MNQTFIIKRVDPLIDQLLRTVIKYGVHTTRGDKTQVVPNPTPFLVQMIYFVVFEKPIAKAPPVYDFGPWNNLTRELVNKKIVPKIEHLLSYHESNPHPDPEWHFDKYVEFLTRSFLRRLKDRHQEPKTMRWDYSDQEDGDFGTYESEVEVDQLHINDWNGAFLSADIGYQGSEYSDVDNDY
jgi:hypothetical protein